MNAERGPAPISQDVQRLVIVLPSWVGDTVMATPVLRAARLALPKAKIMGVMRPGLDDVLRGTPWLDELVVCPMKALGGALRLAAVIRRWKPQAVLLLPNSFRTALAARLSATPIRAGYRRDGRGWLLTHTLAAPKRDHPIPAVDYYAELAEFSLGAPVADRQLELAVTDAARLAADEMLRDVRGPFALLNPGANRADKRWPAECFTQVADELAKRHGLAIVVTGSPSEADVLEAIVQAAKSPIVNLAQRGVTLGSLKGVIQRAAIMITNDTGPRHIAAALGTPVVTLFGPTDHRWTTLHGAREHLLIAEPFLPVELVADGHPKACAIQKIAVVDVLSAVERLMSSQPIRSVARSDKGVSPCA